MKRTLYIDINKKKTFIRLLFSKTLPDFCNTFILLVSSVLKSEDVIQYSGAFLKFLNSIMWYGCAYFRKMIPFALIRRSVFFPNLNIAFKLFLSFNVNNPLYLTFR